MERNYNSSGIILRVQRQGEKNRVLDVLTPDRGIVRATVFGALSARSKLCSSAQSFYCGEFFFYVNPVKQLTKVVDIDLYWECVSLWRDIKRLYAASLLSELLLQSYGSVAGDDRSYNFFMEYLECLDKTSPTNLLRLVNVALWRLLDIWGQQPSLNEKVIIEKTISPSTIMYFVDGEFTNLAEADNSLRLEASERKFLLEDQGKSMMEQSNMYLSKVADRRLFFLLCFMYEHNLGRPLKTLSAGLLP